MIIGKDKERVWHLEVECKLARELIESVRDDMEVIKDHIQENEEFSLIDDLYWRLLNDIGRCSGYLSCVNK